MLPILRGGANILTDFFGAKVESDTVKNLDESILSPFILYGEYYFIFDDLERCSMPINETLGYINNFIEQNNAKVILVAYEEEIGSVEFYEQKLMAMQEVAQRLKSLREGVNLYRTAFREIRPVFGYFPALSIEVWPCVKHESRLGWI